MGLKKRSGTFIRFIVYLIVVILVNVAGITLFFRADLTKNKIYSISDASRQVVSTLSEPLTINVFFTKDLPAPHNNTERYLRDLLEEYSIYSNRHFNYRFYDVSPDEGDISEKAGENQELANNYGVYPVQIRCIEKDEVKFQKAYMGLVLIHGDIIERIPTITSTEGLEYQMTTAIRKLNNKISALLSLKENIHVRLFLSSSLEKVAPYIRVSGLNELPKNLENIVEKVNQKNYGKLEFEYLDPSKDEGLEEKLKKHDILTLRWPAIPGEKIEPGKGAIGLVMEHGAKAVTLQLISILRIPIIGTRYQLVDMKNMEEMINESLESLIDINEDVGYLADYGALSVSPAPPAGAPGQQQENILRNFRNLASQNYTIKNVTLKDSAIPQSLKSLVIAGPTETLDDYALFQIDQFLMKGKNLAIFIDSFKEVMPPNQQGMSSRFNQGPVYVPLKTGLEKLLEHYGVHIKKSYVLDENCYKQRVPVQYRGGERPIYFIPLIKNQFINNRMGFMKNIKGLIAMKTSPVELINKHITKNNLKAHRLFASSEKSWEMSGRINLNPMFIQPPKSEDEQQSLPLAYVIEGRFPSYFADKPIPERKTKETPSDTDNAKKTDDKKQEIDLSKIESEGGILSRGKPGKIFIMASSEMLKDNMLDEEGMSPNAMFLMNLLDYLNDREGIAEMRSKEQRYNPLNETRAGTKTFFKTFNIAGLPVLVVIFGLCIWVRRHSRKQHIRMMFQK